MRILITGSRTWTDRDIIADAIVSAIIAYRLADVPAAPVTIVHGACPQGADSLADGIALDYGWAVERWPADWGQYGRRAGFVRNAAMVNMGASLCLAFIDNASKGATMCANLAEVSGIPVVRFERNGKRQ